MLKEKIYKDYSGTVVFLLTNEGSKSEAVLPYLYINKDCKILIQKEDDNPFENKEILPFDGLRVKIKGYEGRSNTFMVTEISNCELTEGDK